MMAENSPQNPATISSRALSGLAWVFAGAGLHIFIKLAVLIVLARLLTPVEFGLFTIVTMILTFMQFVGRFGISPALVQLPEISERHVGSGLVLSVGFSIVVAVSILALAPNIAGFFGYAELTKLIQVTCIIPVIQGASQISEALLQRKLAFKKLTVIEGISHLFGFGLVSVVLALMNYGVWSLIFAILAQEAIRTIALLTSQRFPLGLHIDYSTARSLFRFGAGVSAIQTVNAFSYQVDNLIVAKMLGASFVGAYGRAYQVLTVPTKLIGNSLLKVMFPALSIIQNDQINFALAVRRSIVLVFALSFPVSAFLAVFAPEIVDVILGNQWADVVAPLRILALAIVFRIGQKICEAVIRSRGRIYALLACQTVFALALFLLAYMGSIYGLSGVATGVAVASFLNFAILLWLTLDTAKMRFSILLPNLMRHTMLFAALSTLLVLLSTCAREAHFNSLATLLVGMIAITGLAGAVLRYLPGLAGPEVVHAINVAKAYYHKRKHRS